jgi:DNA mismatch repair protein PMS2
VLSQIRLRDHGASLIEIADDGKGIQPEDYGTVAAKYHTSKITAFEDVAFVESFGFRGEALSSICAMADVTITTRTADQEVGARLTFDHDGNLQGALQSTTKVRLVAQHCANLDFCRL